MGDLLIIRPVRPFNSLSPTQEAEVLPRVAKTAHFARVARVHDDAERREQQSDHPPKIQYLGDHGVTSSVVSYVLGDFSFSLVQNAEAVTRDQTYPFLMTTSYCQRRKKQQDLLT